ncbi:MAG TPA: acylphosphatase, partial [Ktedonobacteraceae bacterium]|nr:acylphosphatase [Ktedonobacteraceae bacterium]
MPNSYSLRRATLYHASEAIPTWSRGPLRYNSAPLIHPSSLERRRVTVQGLVQGAGFRAFIAKLARRWNLSGHVLSASTGVIIEVQGSERSIEGFLEALLTDTFPF